MLRICKGKDALETLAKLRNELDTLKGELAFQWSKTIPVLTNLAVSLTKLFEV